MGYRIATDNDPTNPNPHAFDLGHDHFETEEECWELIRREELRDRASYGDDWGASIVLHDSASWLVDPSVLEAVLNINSAIRVIAPIWESMKQFGHSGADDMAGAQADLEQAIRFLKGEEEPG